MAVLQSTRPHAAALAVALVLAVGLVAWATPRDRLARFLAEERGGRLVFYDEDAGGTVAVLEQEATGRRSGFFRRLYIQGVSNSGDALPSARYMRLQALLPLLVHPGEPRSVLVLGFGTGITAGALLLDPELETRVVAELLPSVVEAAACFSGNFGAPRDSRLDIRIDDRPLIEHAAWVRRGEIHRVLPRLLELATDVPLVESDPLRPGVSEEVRELRQLYRASLLALDGQQEEAVATVLGVLNRDPNNPYYRWIALGG